MQTYYDDDNNDATDDNVNNDGNSRTGKMMVTA